MATIRHRPNDRIREDVMDALSSHGPPLPSMPHIQASAEAGVVTLRGHVPNATHKAIAGELASAVKGVRFVRNRLVDDQALLARIVTRFRSDDMTHGVHGPVQTFLGTVTPRGPAPSPAFGTRATQLALDTPGVRLVLNQVDVADAEPATVEAWFGRTAVVDGDEVGKVSEVLIDPVTSRVQVVVLVRSALSGLWTAVPASACGASDARYLYLDLTARKFRGLPAGGAEQRPAPEAHALGARTPVTSVWKQQLGRMAGLRFNPRDGQISDVIARRGRFFPAHVWLPMKAMSIGREGELLLTSLGPDDLAARTEAGAPRPAEAIVRAAEGRLLFQGWRATPAGAITIASSERRLVVSGGMRHPADRVAIERLLGSIPGVVGIENRIDIVPPEVRCLPVASLLEDVAA